MRIFEAMSVAELARLASDPGASRGLLDVIADELTEREGVDARRLGTLVRARMVMAEMDAEPRRGGPRHERGAPIGGGVADGLAARTA